MRMKIKKWLAAFTVAAGMVLPATTAFAFTDEAAQQAVEAQRQISDKTNELLRKNAETLKMATVETAKEAERGVVDIETLRATNESLITTLDEVMNIQQEGRQRRQEAEAELQKIEEELKQKLLEIRK